MTENIEPSLLGQPNYDLYKGALLRPGIIPTLTDGLLLADLSQSGLYEARKAALQNPHLPVSMMAYVLNVVPSKPKWNHTIARERWLHNLEYVAENPGLPATLIDEFLAKHFPQTSTGAAPLSRLDSRIGTIRKLVGNPNSPTWLTEWAVAHGDENIQAAAAANQPLTFNQVRVLLVGRPRRDVETSHLVRDIYLNPQIPEQFLIDLIPELATAPLVILAGRLDGATREKCVNTLMLWRHGQHGRRGAALYTTNPTVLSRLAGSKLAAVRLNLATNFAISPTIITRLCGDGDSEVRRQAVKHPKATDTDKVTAALLEMTAS